ncbi:hypothetical protein PG279_10115 [Riemerella anatipestifer]|nr:hypothetical protein [Riemerella anatipestifer]
MKVCIILSMIVLLNSCGQNIREKINTNQAMNSLPNASENMDLTITLPKSKNNKIPKKWESVNSIPKKWIEIKKDSDGYLVYEPCDGDTRSISFRGGYLFIKYQIEPENKFRVDKFIMGSDKKSFMLNVYEETTQCGFPILVKITDADNGLVLWEFKNETIKEKWLMTPLENAMNFRKIKNNCPDFKRKELKFIEEN